MGLYRRVWITVLAALVVAGVLFAAISLSISALVGMALLAATLSGAVVGIRDGQAELTRLWRSGGLVRRYVLVALTGAAIGPATAGWVAVTGPLGVAVVVFIAACAPPTVTWVRHMRHSHPEATPPQAGHPASASALMPLVPTVSKPMDHLSDEEVAFAWRCSYIVLLRARSAAELASVIDIRSQCLDELERRNPAGFNQWIAAGARAASDPSRYMNPTRRADSTE